MALINKRKLCKPVETSEKEATDKKKGEEEKKKKKKEDEKKNEEVAAKSSARTATRSSGLLANTLKLDLEGKKKSEERSFLGFYASSSSSSSSDQELTSDEENERERQKSGEESDGRRPMAEEERKVTDGNNGEILLPWKAEDREKTQSRILIEEISEFAQCSPDEADRKSRGEQVSNGSENVQDLIGDCIVDRKIVTFENEKTVTEREMNKKEITKRSIDSDNINEIDHIEKTLCSVSCDTSDLKRILEEDKKPKIYQRKSKDYSICSKLSSIREEMKEFCDGMDRFVDENKIVFKNGEVEGFWSERETANEHPQGESVDESENRETEDKVSASEEENKLRWWCSRERKLKVKEILRKREDEARKNKMKLEDTRKNSDHYSSDDKNQTADITNNIQSVCDSKTATNSSTSVLVVDSTKTYSAKDAENDEKSRIDVGAEKPNISSTENVILDLSLLDKEKASDSISSPEEKMSNIIPRITNSTEFVDSDKQSSNCENIADTKSVKTETLEDRFVDLSLESLEEGKTIDESDADSFRTATSVQEDSQSLDNNQESSEGSNTVYAKDNCTDRGLTDNENIDDVANSHKKIDEEHNDAICENKNIDKMENFSDKIESSNGKSDLLNLPSLTGSVQAGLYCLRDRPGKSLRTKDWIGPKTHSSLKRTSQFSRLAGKRIREVEDIEYSEEECNCDEVIYSRRKPEKRRPRSQISERCRQHVIQETRKFVKKASPLIDKCIASLMEDAENSGKKLCHKYDRRSLGEFLPSGFESKIDFKKSASEERSNLCDKYKNESTNVTNLWPYAALTNNLDIQSLANLFCESKNTSKPDSPVENAVSHYKESCDYLHELESKKKLLISPDFATANQESKESFDNKSLEECSIKKSVEPLIEVISESSATFEDSERSLRQRDIKENLHDRQNTIDCHQKDVTVVFKRFDEMSEISENPEKRVNEESRIDSKEETKVGMFSTSCTLSDNADRKECALEKEKSVITTTKKSIEMQVAQEN
ncbi:dentin sialophosphoprotein-like [Pseudomyrmex gracilis]|uniref:dentin sialophosphoprotein-like n=1 Tax=Pseudomyrmex gracilis TaxID=219809 RepID=UPI0009956E32|nr:dentin sialophosphoprotein-like [Pseudomyrmex gracilis]